MCIDKLASQCHLMFSHNYIAFITFYPPSYSLHACAKFRLFENLWTVARHAPLSMGFSRQEYWNGLLCPTPWDLNPGIETMSLTSPALAGRFFTTSATWEAHMHSI